MRMLIASTLAATTLLLAAVMPASAGRNCGWFKMYDGRVIYWCAR